MLSYLRRNLPFLILLVGIVSYIFYFSLFTINRNDKFYSHYFDLGIMHQTVYNTYKGLATGDISRILELTDPHTGTSQIKRMAIHNDIFLALLSSFYFIYSGPETLLVIQSFVLGVGAYFVFKISTMVFEKSKKAELIGLIFAYTYLLYPPLQKSNNFDFHAVTLATTFLLTMFYFYLKKKYLWSGLFAFLSILTKEQVGLTVGMFGFYIFRKRYGLFFFSKNQSFKKQVRDIFRKNFHEIIFAGIIGLVGIVWVLISMIWVIPHFRMSAHFGTEYFSYIFTNPGKIIPMILRGDSIHYVYILSLPVGFLSLFSIPSLVIGMPDLVMNILSTNSNMTNIYFHYTALITPFIFISAIYGAHNFLYSDLRLFKFLRSKIVVFKIKPSVFVFTIIILAVVASSLYMSPLPWGHHRDMFPWQTLPAKAKDVSLWARYLKDDQVKVSATGHIAVKFTSRQYYYHFANGYDLADYVIVDRYDISAGFQKELKEKQYRRIISDWRYIRIYDNNGIEVYKKILNLKI